MQVHEIQIELLEPASWNSNVMEPEMLDRLRNSLDTFGLIQPLVVRKLDGGKYEIIGGSHRFRVLTETGATTAPCVIIDTDGASSRLLAQALNRIEGEEDPGLQSESFKKILESYRESDLLTLLPETPEGLRELRNLGSLSPDEYSSAWQRKKRDRLRHFRFRVSKEQLPIIERAISLVAPESLDDPTNPNRRDNALVRICQAFIERQNC